MRLNPSVLPLAFGSDDAPPEPAPRDVRPMEPITARVPSVGDRRWAYQPAWPGQRVTVHLHGAPTGLGVWPPLRIAGPDGVDLTWRFPELAPLALDQPRRPRVLDAIIVTATPAAAPGRPAPGRDEGVIDLRVASRPPPRALSPGDLAYRLAATSAGDATDRALAAPVQLLVLDLVHAAGRRVGDLPYVRRRVLLGSEVPRAPDGALWQIPPDHLSLGEALAEAVHHWGTGALVAKRLDSRYFPGFRSAGWCRLDFPIRAELVVAGWVRSARGGRLEGLVLATEAPDGSLRWAGVARRGLTLSIRTELGRAFGRLVTDRPTLGPPPRGLTLPGAVRWLQPVMRVDVAASDDSRQGRLDQLVVLGLDLDG